MTYFVKGVVLHFIDPQQSQLTYAPRLDTLSPPEIKALQDATPGAMPPPTTIAPLTGHGIKMDVNPYFGAAFFFLAGALRLHPATATAGLVLGVGAAVINYGAGTAAAQEPVDFGSDQPGWLKPHF